MNELVPMMFSFIVSGAVAAGFISLLLTGALDGLARFVSDRPEAKPTVQPRETGI